MRKYNGENSWVVDLERDPCSPVNNYDIEVGLEIELLIWKVDGETYFEREIKETIQGEVARCSDVDDLVAQDIVTAWMQENYPGWEWEIEKWRQVGC